MKKNKEIPDGLYCFDINGFDFTGGSLLGIFDISWCKYYNDDKQYCKKLKLKIKDGEKQCYNINIKRGD